MAILGGPPDVFRHEAAGVPVPPPVPVAGILGAAALALEADGFQAQLEKLLAGGRLQPHSPVADGFGKGFSQQEDNAFSGVLVAHLQEEMDDGPAGFLARERGGVQRWVADRPVKAAGAALYPLPRLSQSHVEVKISLPVGIDVVGNNADPAGEFFDNPGNGAVPTGWI